MSRNTLRIVLGERDVALLRFIGEHETATFGQIKAKFWPDSVTPQTCMDRLHKLRKAGYLTRHAYRPDTGTQTSRFSLNRKAIYEFGAETATRLYTGTLNDGEVEQAVKAVHARLELERRGYMVQGWISERHLRSTQQQVIAYARRNGMKPTAEAIADGQAIIADAHTGEIVAMDVEIDGQYWGRMLEKKLQGFAGRQVFWATTPARAARIQRAAPANIKVVTV